ncbi:MAG: FecR family protein [Methylacidiphilales bacterium]|nr:FecR family protein [Candidatus Methylacidiphilales bacterium]
MTPQLKSFHTVVLTCILILTTAGLQAQTFKVLSGGGDVGKDAKSYQPAKANADYALGWWARTAEGVLKIEFSPENIFRLLPNSEVQVNGTGAANTKFRRIVELKAGKVDFDLPKLSGSKVEVETPTAVCGAVGTQFSVDSETGQFDVPKGRIYAKAKGDSTFEAESAGGHFAINPGKENAYSDGQISGAFLVNGKEYNATNASFEVAKARGGEGQAAVQVNGGSLGGAGSGSYIMEGGRLQPVDSRIASTHAAYLSAAKEEGSLNVRRETLVASGRPVPASLDQQLNAAAAKATELRKRLFQRNVIRDTAKETARDVIRQTHP